ncbi:Ger(x)C family spore germination protein [Halobacillus sp. B23F22_1]|uniref:Ger(x)C family spore germination protein n=1 Tax=Halobacillus sp. B23F22_1 TaxID=3459514 RepID=UPI00373F46C6
MMLKIWFLFMSFVTLFFLSGCWDSDELKDIGITTAIGIDKGGNNVEDRYRVTVQVVNPSQISGGQQGEKVQSSPVRNYSTTGSTLSEALQKMRKKSGTLFLPHLQLMVIGEEMAKEGIDELFDVTERDAELRAHFPVLIISGNTAEEALKITTSLESIPSESIIKSLKSVEKEWGEYTTITAHEVIKQLNEGNLVIPGIQIIGDIEKGNQSENMQQISPNARVNIEGMALIKRGKLTTWIEKDAARGVNWIVNKINRTVTNLDCKEKEKAISIEVVRAQSNIEVNVENQKPIIHVNVHAEGNVMEAQCNVDLENYAAIERLQTKLNEEIKNEILAAITVANEEQSDYFGFNEKVNIADKKLWKKIKNEWDEEIFPETEVKVNVEAFIRRTGMRTKP